MKGITTALRKMGYRQHDTVKGYWSKPFADMIFCFSLETNEISSFFKGVDDKFFCNESASFKEDEWNVGNTEKYTTEQVFLLFIKNFERYTTVNRGKPSFFEFLTPEEYYENILG